MFIETCRDEPRGVFVSINEIQKVPQRDISTICGAFQIASRKSLDVMAPEERSYLAAMARVADSDRIAQTGKVARALGKTPQQASRARQTLLKNGIVIAVGRGQLMFNIPYLRECIEKEPAVDANAELVRLWKL